MKNKNFCLNALIVIAVLAVAMTSCSNSKNDPVLKVTTSTSYDVFGFFSKTNYYIVYENGKKKKTSKFVPADVVCYYFRSNNADDIVLLHDTDINTLKGEKMNKIARDILLLSQKTKLKNVSVGRIYIFDERYFFGLLCEKGNYMNTKIFEYILADNSIKELATFTKSVTHIELYEGQ
ncbi:hypothetical protein FACS1894132_12610 [Clostridia bacterium]|nr:hypothetical protein FACS1894132_12610 [Clostridia bacterium]